MVWAKYVLIFQNSGSHFKILDTRMVAWSKFTTEYSKILGGTGKKIRRHCDVAPEIGLGLRSSGMLRGVGWCFVTDVSGYPIFPIFKGQAVLCGVTSQQSEGLNYTAAEGWKLARIA
jgi:hypothetical protein